MVFKKKIQKNIFHNKLLLAQVRKEDFLLRNFIAQSTAPFAL